jgi:mannonate dehydratase
MLRQGWRWFGPNDPVPLDHVRQAGAAEIVTALHQVPIGEAWTDKAVAERKSMIEATKPGQAPLRWTVTESIPIPDDVKRTGAKAKASIEAWIASMEALARNDVRIVCYNFMPVVDWARTDLDAPMPTGATALRFDYVRFAAFELFILERPGAEADFDEATRAKAKAAYEAMSQAEIDYLIMVIASALPGSTTEPGVPRQARAIQGHRPCAAAPASRRVPGGGDAGGGAARRDADAASG